MTREEALVALNLTSAIAGIKLQQMLDVFGAPERIFDVSLRELSGVPGIGEKIAERIRAVTNAQVDDEFRLSKKLGLEIVTINDDAYPVLLKEIPDAPIVIYVKGELRKDEVLTLAVVGSRRASFYGLSSAERFSAELSDRGLTIVSGMARGIDSAAHRGALKSGGRTIAVMGSGFNYIYPVENKSLCEEIAKSGAVISEFPINAEPRKENFPRRNRIISGLSRGVFVVEAAQNSGALITADFALEQGRDVFALPGKVDVINSFGANELIRQGARLVCRSEDILEEFAITKKLALPADSMIGTAKLNIAEKEGILYNLISYEPVVIDELLDRAGLEISNIFNALLNLQMKKLVRQLPGKLYVRA